MVRNLSRNRRLVPALAALLLGGVAARATTLPDDIRRTRLDWADARYQASISIQRLGQAGGGGSEVGPGFMFQGPDPFRRLDYEGSDKWASRWRLGVNKYDVSALGVSTELTVLSLGGGWDYYFNGGAREAAKLRGGFASGYVMGYFPDRSGSIPGRRDRDVFGFSLGGGFKFGRLYARFEHAFLFGDEGDADNISFGFTF